jgi:hypothetical protein
MAGLPLPRLGGTAAPAGASAAEHHLELTPFRSKDGLAAATSDEFHLNMRDREYGVQPRRRGCMHYLQHQGQQQRPLIAASPQPSGQSNVQRPGKRGC